MIAEIVLDNSSRCEQGSSDEFLNKKFLIIVWKNEYSWHQNPVLMNLKDQKRFIYECGNTEVMVKEIILHMFESASVFDKEDLNAVYKLVMDIYQDKIPEGFDKVLWGDLIVMFNPDEQDEFWNSQHEWKVVSWKLHSSSGVHTLMTDRRIVVHMLNREEVSFEKGNTDANDKLKLVSDEESIWHWNVTIIMKVLAD
ncbi:hypothetical protein Tco_0763769 [Tanacetum coccineum]